MNAIMNFKITTFGKKFSANFTLKRFYTLVCSNMNLQSTSPRVSLFAKRAFKRQLTSMNQFMRLLVTFSYKLLATSLVKTHKWTFSSLKILCVN